MALEDIVQEGIPVKLDKERHLRLLNRGYRVLATEFGSIREAISALQNITPRQDEAGITIVPEQDSVFFDSFSAWLFACLTWEDKGLTKSSLMDIMDNMSFFDLVGVRVDIWRAFSQSLPKAQVSEASEDDDPTSPTA